jgi:hypothetical protein
MSSYVLMSCFLGGDDSLYDLFSDIGTALRSSNMELVIVGAWGVVPSRSGFQTLNLPFSLVDQGRRFQHFYGRDGLPMSMDGFEEFIGLEKDQGRSVTLSDEIDIQRSFALWQNIFHILSPVVVVAWGTTTPISRIMLRFAQLRSLPAYVLERGYLDDTLLFNAAGQNALSITNMATDLIIRLDDCRYEEKWTQISEFYKNKVSGRYSEYNKPIDKEFENFLLSRKVPIIFYIGSHDNGAGIFFGKTYNKNKSNWIDSSRAAFLEVVKYVKNKKLDCILLYKPHLGAPFDVIDDEIEIINVSGFDVSSIIKLSDVVINLSSGTQFLTFIYEKPLVTMGNSFLSGYNAAYESFDFDTLCNQIDISLNRFEYKEKLSTGRILTAALFDKYLVGLKEDVPTTLKLSAIIQTLLRFRSHDSSTSGKENMDDLRAFISAADNVESWAAREDTLLEDIRQVNLHNVSLQDVILKLENRTAEIELQATKRYDELGSKIELLEGTRVSLEGKIAQLLEIQTGLETESAVLTQRVDTLNASVMATSSELNLRDERVLELEASIAAERFAFGEEKLKLLHDNQEALRNCSDSFARDFQQLLGELDASRKASDMKTLESSEYIEKLKFDISSLNATLLQYRAGTIGQFLTWSFRALSRP